MLNVVFSLQVSETNDWSETAREVKINTTLRAMNDTYQRANSTCRFKWILLTACGFACGAGAYQGLRIVTDRLRAHRDLFQETTEKMTAVQIDCITAETPERMYINVISCQST